MNKSTGTFIFVFAACGLTLLAAISLFIHLGGTKEPLERDSSSTKNRVARESRPPDILVNLDFQKHSPWRLNEVLFFASGSGRDGVGPTDCEWVEIRNIGSDPASISGFEIANEKGDGYVFQDELPPVPAGECVLISFDGAGPAADVYRFPDGGARLHSDSPSRNFFDDTADSCILYAPDRKHAIDFVSWGDYGHDGRYVNNMLEYGSDGPVEAGQSIGVDPQSDATSDSVAWAIYPQVKITPGAKNPAPTPLTIVPFQDWEFRQDKIDFAWRVPSSAAEEYLLEVDDNPDFSNPEISTRTKSSSYESEISLAPGTYHWRIKAVDDQSRQTDWSMPGRFRIAGQARSKLIKQKDLGVRGLRQHKDTALICLHCEERGRHSWNAYHWAAGSHDCKHCRSYCARASVAMINHHFEGSMLQDEISFIVFGEEDEYGPCGKLGHGKGFSPERHELETAIRGVMVHPIQIAVTNYQFGRVVTAIDNDCPIIGVLKKHAVVIDGYELYEDADESALHVMQPYTGKQEIVPVGETKMLYLWVIPADSEGRQKNPEIARDTDGDRLNDFDERYRLRSDPGYRDTDADGLLDYKEVRAYLFGKGRAIRFPGRGWGIWDDENFDDDPLLDGEEDVNCNGNTEPTEWDPFFFEMQSVLKLDLAGADLKDQGPIVRLNGKFVGNLKPTGNLAGYLHRDLPFVWCKYLEPGEENKLKISVAGFDDIQIRNVRLLLEDSGSGQALVDDTGVYHLGDDDLEDIKQEIEDGEWHDPNGLKFWKELYEGGYSVTFKFVWPGPTDGTALLSEPTEKAEFPVRR